MTARLSIGVAGSLGPAAIATLAEAAERAGMSGLWINDTADGDALSGLAAAAASTTRLRLATGVLPMDRHSPQDVAARVADLPADRITLGVGSGAARTGQLDLVADAVEALRTATTASVMVGALGPRMRRLAAERADGPLLSWLDPRTAAEQAAAAHDVDGTAHVALYVRTALDEGAVPKLREETQRYAGYQNYAANFARLGIDPVDTVLDPDTVTTRLAQYRAAVDEVVLRAITPGDEVADYERFIEGVAALADGDA